MIALAGQTTVLIVTRNESLVDRLLPQLAIEGFKAEVVPDIDPGVVTGRSRPGVVVLDAAVGAAAVRALCQGARASGRTAVLVVSTADTDDSDPVELLRAGADDYVVRADRVHELIARMRAILRRQPDAADDCTDRVEVGDVVLDRERHVVLVADNEVHVPLKQFQLLELLLTNAGRVLTRDRLLEHAWGIDGPRDSNTLEVQVKRLRAAIEDDPRHPTRIKTVRGLGYMYTAASHR